MLPKILTDFNCFVDGVGYVGRAKQVVLPKVVKTMQEVNNSGMAGAVEMPTGYEAMTAELTFDETPNELVRLMGKNNANAINIRLVGKFFDPNSANKKVDTEVTVSGKFKEQDMGELKRGEQPQTKYVAAVDYYKYAADGETLQEIDMLKPFDPEG